MEVTIPDNSSYDPAVHLNFTDIAFNNGSSPSMVRITLKCSKTDPFRQGVSIHIGQTDNTPVKALLSYLCSVETAQASCFILKTIHL